MRVPHPARPASATALALGAAASLLAGCAGSGSDEDPGSSGGAAEGSCAAALELHGRTYLGHGDLRRDPEVTGRRLDVLLPGCADSGGQDDPVPERTAEAEELAEVPAEVAVLLHDGVYVREGADLPPAARAWFAAPSCEHVGEVDLAGTWLGVTGPHEPRSDGDIRPPYRIDVEVTAGPAAYAGASVTIRVTGDTDPVLTADDVRDTLWEGGQVRARVGCDGEKFVASSVRSAG